MISLRNGCRGAPKRRHAVPGQDGDVGRRSKRCAWTPAKPLIGRPQPQP